MPAISTSQVIRKILEADLEMSADLVIKKVKSRGVTTPAASIRPLVHKVRSQLKHSKVKLVPSAAQKTSPPKSKDKPVDTASTAPDLANILANVALVNKVVGTCGGMEHARQLAEAVRSCGGVAEFLQHLELITSIKA